MEKEETIEPEIVSRKKYFFSNPIVSFISLIVGILAIVVSIFLYLMGIKKRELTYSCYPIKTPIVQANKLTPLEVSYKGYKILKDVTAVQIAIWNKGNLPILSSDIIEDIVIQTIPTTRILEASIQKCSRDIIKFKISEEYLEKGKIPVSWKILEHNDGALIQVIIEGGTDTELTLSGAIIGQSAVNMQVTKQINHRGKELIFLGILLIIFSIFACYLAIKFRKKPSLKVSNAKYGEDTSGNILIIIDRIEKRTRFKQSKNMFIVSFIYFVLGLALLMIYIFSFSRKFPPFGF